MLIEYMYVYIYIYLYLFIYYYKSVIYLASPNVHTKYPAHAAAKVSTICNNYIRKLLAYRNVFEMQK